MNRNTFLRQIGLGGLTALGLSFITPKPKVAKNKVIEFTPEILKKYNFGLYIINDKADVVDRPDYAATVAWKLTYNLQVVVNNVKGKKEVVKEWPKHSITNFLTDGWAYPIGNTLEEVCEYLNNNPQGTKFRIMTKDELFYIINNRSNSKQLFYE